MQSFWQSSTTPLIFRFDRLHCRSWLLRTFLFSIGLLTVAETARAQATAKSNIEERTLITDDQVELKVSYFRSSSGKDAPVVIMLHGKKGTRLEWKSLATELQTKRDFAVLTVDLRGHGQSQLKRTELKKSDYQAMAAMDMEAVRTFLLEEHQKGQLNISKQGIVACDFSAAIALVYAEIDWQRTPYDDSPAPELRTPRGQDIKALSLISPEVTTSGLYGSKAATTLRNFPIAIMIGASEKNTHDLSAAKKLFEQISAKREKASEFIFFEKYQEDVRGMDLIKQDPQIRGHIVGFLDKFVKQSPVEWKDRRSRLERE